MRERAYTTTIHSLYKATIFFKFWQHSGNTVVTTLSAEKRDHKEKERQNSALKTAAMLFRAKLQFGRCFYVDRVGPETSNLSICVNFDGYDGTRQPHCITWSLFGAEPLENPPNI